MIKSKNYRQDIQGLRALAVIVVCLYHFNVPGFEGGFIGVDIFFVVSGYLITSNILRDLKNNTFSISNFYLRRFFRLFPALLATLVVTFLLAIVIFPAPMLATQTIAAASSITFVSNFLFSVNTGYFGETGLTEPFLHTWSLSVEEQFYIIWPFFIMLLIRMRYAIGLLFIVLVSIVGVVISEAGVRYFEHYSFYLVPFRIFEFAIGGVVAFSRGSFKPVSRLHSHIYAFGLVLVIVVIALIDKSAAFPGFNAFILCIAIECMLWADKAKGIRYIFNMPLMVYIGTISYSLYLVHWPISVFYRYSISEVFVVKDILVLCLLTSLFGVILYYGVERACRLNRSSLTHVVEFSKKNLLYWLV